ncbi:MAG TPA: hypothetical protein VM096_13185 [Vicinamibacterales bacterium]|nr:hypothetical protein [Vicinamibacterales bacterium]
MAKALSTVLVFLLAIASTVNAQNVLTPAWTKTLAKGGRFLTAHDLGRCLVVDQNGAIEVLDETGALSWKWDYRKVSRLIYPQETAVSPDCDAIAATGSATYKYTWLVDRNGKSVSIGSMGTPSDVAFDATGQHLLIGTFTGMLQMHGRTGDLLLTRAVRAPMAIEGIEMVNDDGRVAFKKREGRDADSQYDSWLLASTADPKRKWMASTERIACLDEQGRVLAEIPSQTFYREVVVSRDFGQVVRIDREGNTTRLFGYTVTAPCKP